MKLDELIPTRTQKSKGQGRPGALQIQGKDVQTAWQGEGWRSHHRPRRHTDRWDGARWGRMAVRAPQVSRESGGLASGQRVLHWGQERAELPPPPHTQTGPQCGGRTPRLLRGRTAHGAGGFAATLGRRCPQGEDGWMPRSTKTFHPSKSTEKTRQGWEKARDTRVTTRG